MNPLVAGLGAVGIAGYGFASSLGSIAGAAVAVVPGLAGLLSMVFAVKKAFGGVGSVFSAFTKMNEASGGGGGGAAAKETLTRAEQLARAQEDYRRAIEDVTFAEEELDDARKDALDRMNQLQRRWIGQQLPKLALAPTVSWHVRTTRMFWPIPVPPRVRRWTPRLGLTRRVSLFETFLKRTFKPEGSTPDTKGWNRG